MYNFGEFSLINEQFFIKKAFFHYLIVGWAGTIKTFGFDIKDEFVL